MLFWPILSLLIISFQPAAKKTETFYTRDGRIYAPNGEEFIARGVNKMFFFNDRTGMLLVRTTRAELDLIERALTRAK